MTTQETNRPETQTSANSDSANKLDQQIVLRRHDLKALGIGVSNSTLLRWEFNGRFPRRIRMAGTSVAWIKPEVDIWLAERAAERADQSYSDPY